MLFDYACLVGAQDELVRPEVATNSTAITKKIVIAPVGEVTKYAPATRPTPIIISVSSVKSSNSRRRAIMAARSLPRLKTCRRD